MAYGMGVTILLFTGSESGSGIPKKLRIGLRIPIQCMNHDSCHSISISTPILQSDREQSKTVGFAAALSACVLSGLAGVYFEKILKGSTEVSVWMRNVQLSLLSLPLGFGMAFIKDGADIANNGFFFG